MRPMTRTFKAGTYLFRENDRSRELYLIQSGKVKVFRALGNREIDLATLGKGAVLGEMSLIDGKPRSASAKAVQDATVVLIDADTFHTKIRGVPPWFMTIIRMVSQKIRSANKHLERMQFDKRGINVILALQYYFDRQAAQGGGTQLDLSTTRDQLTQLLSVTQHRIAYVLDFLQHHGFISVSEDKIECTDTTEFNEYCSFLRLLVRKSFDKVQPAEEPLKQIVLAMELAGGGAGQAGQQQTMSGAQFESLAAEAGAAQEAQALVDSLKKNGVLTVKKADDAPKEGSALAGSVLYIDTETLHRHALYYKFSNVVPSA